MRERTLKREDVVKEELRMASVGVLNGNRKDPGHYPSRAYGPFRAAKRLDPPLPEEFEKSPSAGLSAL